MALLPKSWHGRAKMLPRRFRFPAQNQPGHTCLIAREQSRVQQSCDEEDANASGVAIAGP